MPEEFTNIAEPAHDAVTRSAKCRRLGHVIARKPDYAVPEIQPRLELAGQFDRSFAGSHQQNVAEIAAMASDPLKQGSKHQTAAQNNHRRDQEEQGQTIERKEANIEHPFRAAQHNRSEYGGLQDV